MIDVPGALHLSTAPRLNFADGSVWDTRSAAPSTLSVAAPESFGFIGGQAAAALRWQDTNLQTLQPGSALELAGGAVSIERSLLVTENAPIRVQAATLTVAGSPGVSSGFVSLVTPGAAAGSGAIDLRVAGEVSLQQGTLIRTANFSSSAAGALRIEAGAMTVAGGAQISSLALGDAGGAEISLATTSLRLDGVGADVFSSGRAGGAGAIRVNVAAGLEVLGGATIQSSNSGTSAPGGVSIQAATVTLEGSGSSIGSIAQGAAANAAAVRIEATQRVLIANGAQALSFTLGGGNGGAVDVSAPVIELRGNPAEATGISSGSFAADSGHAGAVTVSAGRLTASAGAQIGSLTVSDLGDAADVTVRADSMLFDGGGFGTVIQSYAGSAFGNAGAVRVEARGELILREGGGISAGTLGLGRSGSVDVRAATLRIDGRGANVITGIGAGAVQGTGAAAPVSVNATGVELRDGGVITSLTATPGAAGTIRIIADTLTVDGGALRVPTGISSDSVAAGNAGNIDIQAREVRVANRGLISSSALAGGRGGIIRIETQGLTVDGAGISSGAFATGDAGSIDIRARDARLTNGAFISSSTFGAGSGGTIGLEAQSLTVASAAGLLSGTTGTGNAGRIDVRVAGAMALVSGGRLIANTTGAGAGGQVQVNAGSLLVSGLDADGFPSGIASRAQAGSGGRPGSVTIDVTGAVVLRDGAILNIANEATVAGAGAPAPAALILRGGEITLSDALITAASTQNANAGRITVETPGRLRLERAGISTSALDGDGGPITISAGRYLQLRDSRITTSVQGSSNGNGGDITISGGALVLSSGFIQANTAAPLARGGQVTASVGLLVPDGSNVFVGGNRIAAFRSGVSGFNVIQAAAPDGVAGQLDVTIPELNLAGSLAGLATPQIDFGPLGRDWCEPGLALPGGPAGLAAQKGETARRQSSLLLLGRGATLAPAAGPLRIVP